VSTRSLSRSASASDQNTIFRNFIHSAARDVMTDPQDATDLMTHCMSLSHDERPKMYRRQMHDTRDG
jgi:hypothetical protein